jgi:hypothetical protein
MAIRASATAALPRAACFERLGRTGRRCRWRRRWDREMTTFTQASTQLNVNGLQLLALMSNPQFPTPTSGNELSSTWASGINTFASLWSATIANGWKVSTAAHVQFHVRRRARAGRLLHAGLQRPAVRHLIRRPAASDGPFTTGQKRSLPWHRLEQAGYGG